MKNDKTKLDVIENTNLLINIEEPYKNKKEQNRRLVDNNEKLPLILFSGGLDSTYLLSETLKNGSCDILYIAAAQGENKIKAEQEACKKIIKWLEKNKPFKIRNTYFVDITSLPVITNYSFSQPSSWIFGALSVCNENIHNEVQIAYVLGDQISCHLINIHDAWNALSIFSKHQKINLIFPLCFTTKNKIMKEMEPKLYNLTWVCETPIKLKRYNTLKPCSKCASCINRKVEEYRLTLT